MGGMGAADIFPRQANMSVSLAHTAIRIFHLFPSRPIAALNTGRVSLTNTGLYPDPPRALLPTQISLQKKSLDFVWLITYGHHCTVHPSHWWNKPN